MAKHARITPAAQKSAGTVYSPKALARFEAALADLALASRMQLELVVQAGIEALDALDGDCDLEIQCEDEGAQCEDDGWDTEPDHDDEQTAVYLAQHYPNAAVQ